MWKDGKPEPFERLREDSEYVWEQLEQEIHSVFVDRLHEHWKALEDETKHELVKLASTQKWKPIGNDGEVAYVEFVWEDRALHLEKFLKVDLSDGKNGFKASKILENIDTKMADYDRLMAQDAKTREKLVQYLVARDATENVLKKNDEIKKIIANAYQEMNARGRDQWEDWIAEGVKALRGEKTTEKFLKNAVEYRKRYTSVMDQWETWSSGQREWTTDKKLIIGRNQFASNPKNDILRRPSYKGDATAIYIAVDKNFKLFIFLDPQGIPWSYNEEVHKRMKEDTHEFYTKIKAPVRDNNKRHVSESEHLRANPALKIDWCGSDHYGHWHPAQHEHDPMIETSDSLSKINAEGRQLLLQFLGYTGGTMTRVLDFWFGV